jgi:hypothetical protein
VWKKYNRFRKLLLKIEQPFKHLSDKVKKNIGISTRSKKEEKLDKKER